MNKIRAIWKHTRWNQSAPFPLEYIFYINSTDEYLNHKDKE